MVYTTFIPTEINSKKLKTHHRCECIHASSAGPSVFSQIWLFLSNMQYNQGLI